MYHRLNPDYDDPKYFDQNKEYAYFFNVIELIILESPCYRLHYIVDLKGSKMGHVLKINPMTMKKVAVVLEVILFTFVKNVKIKCPLEIILFSSIYKENIHQTTKF